MQPRDKFFNTLLNIRATASAPESVAAGEPAVLDAGKALDSHAMAALREAMASSAQQGRWNYVLDLSRVTAVDSSGLGMLVSALRSVRDAGGSVGLVTNRPAVQRILELCARNRKCFIFTQTADAVAALSPSTRPKTAA